MEFYHKLKFNLHYEENTMGSKTCKAEKLS